MVRIKTMEWMKPKIIPKRMERKRKAKIWAGVSTPGTIKEAKRQARTPVAPREKSIRPEFRLVLRAKAAINVMVRVLSMMRPLARLSNGEVEMMKKPVPEA